MSETAANLNAGHEERSNGAADWRQPGERLRQLCAAILGLLGQQPDGSCRLSPNPGQVMRLEIERELVGKLEEGVRNLGERLRQELSVLFSAIAQLDRLSHSSYLGSQAAVLALKAELERAAAQASGLAEALEGLAIPGFIPAPSEVRTLAFPETPALPFLLKQQEEPALRQETAVASRPPAQVHYAQGERHRRANEYDQAIAHYTEAIGSDPGHLMAYLQRGRVYQCQGDHDSAVADFTAAIRLDPLRPAVFLLRGNAWMSLSRLEAAITDYSAALDLDPGQAVAYLNRGLAYMKRSEFAAAAADAKEALRLQPDLAGAYFIRGAAHADSGEHERAVADFTQVLKHDPQHAAARKRLQQALLAQRDRQARAEPKASEDAKGWGPEAARSEKEMSASSAPPDAAAEARSGVLRLVCPDCGVPGAVRWDRLGHVLKCRGCVNFFAVHSNGQLMRVVRTSDGRWVEPGKLPVGKREVARRWSVRLLPIACVLAIVVLGGWFWTRQHRPPSLPELPRELQARAQLMGDAWRHKDVALMRRLTSTTHDRVLYAWLIHHPISAGSGAGGPEQDAGGRGIETRILEKTDQAANVVIRIKQPSSSGRYSVVELRQHWVARGGDWYFVPSLRADLPRLEKRDSADTYQW